jgi:N-acetylated-alpha-linked acidic dipeptidase
LKLNRKDNGVLIHQSWFLEDDHTDKTQQAYCPYSGSGKIETDSIIYVNYGRASDFEIIKRKSINLRGKLLLARYYDSYPGTIIENAEKNEARGILLYEDPKDQIGFGSLRAYPLGPLRNSSSILRSTSMNIHNQYPGDPLTPGYPATEDAFRLKREQAKNIPNKNFIVQPISARDARFIMSTIRGNPAPSDWFGGLNLTYNIGGEMSDIVVNLRVDLDEYIAPIYNVIAKIKGNEEKDSSVMIGNHRDAFGFGTTHPNTGTVVILEIAKAIGNLLQNKYKPRRNIIISSWDANELGMIGSTEFVEQYKFKMTHELVSYLDIDSIVGDSLNFQFSPSLMSFVESQSRRVESPTFDNETLFDEWKRQNNEQKLLHGGQDYTAFTQQIGIASSSIGFTGAFGAYHSLHDNMDWFSKFGDFTFSKTKAVTHLCGMMLLRLASNIVLPFTFTRQSKDIVSSFEYITNSRRFQNFTGELEPKDAMHFFSLMKKFNATIENYSTSMKVFDVKIEKMVATANKNGASLAVKQLNDLMLSLEKSFLDTEGLIYSKWHKNIIFGPEKTSGYRFRYFPEFQSFLREKNYQGVSFSIQRSISILENAILVVNSN